MGLVDVYEHKGIKKNNEYDNPRSFVNDFENAIEYDGRNVFFALTRSLQYYGEIKPDGTMFFEASIHHITARHIEIKEEDMLRSKIVKFQNQGKFTLDEKNGMSTNQLESITLLALKENLNKIANEFVRKGQYSYTINYDCRKTIGIGISDTLALYRLSGINVCLELNPDSPLGLSIKTMYPIQTKSSILKDDIIKSSTVMLDEHSRKFSLSELNKYCDIITVKHPEKKFSNLKAVIRSRTEQSGNRSPQNRDDQGNR